MPESPGQELDSELPELPEVPELPELLELFEGGPVPGRAVPPGPPPGPQPPAMPEGAGPATSVSIAVVPSDVTVLKATVSPTDKALSVVLSFFSMSLVLVTAYVALPLLVLMLTLESPTAVMVPCRGSGEAPGGAAGL